MLSLHFPKMNRFRKTIDYLFGYNRREKRASFTLIVFLIILLIIRYISLPDRQPTITVNFSGTQGQPDSVNAPSAGPEQLFVFDPNTVTQDELIQLGLTNRQASTFIKYRNSGARFRRAEDIGNVFGISTKMVDELAPYVIIEDKKDKPGGSHPADTFSVKKRIDKLPETCLIELNSCTSEDLIKLPGIGEVLSGRIIRFRDLLGGFVSTEQLGEVFGIDTSLVAGLLGMVYVETDSVKKISIDTCCYRTLARHPYIGPVVARSILKYRKLIGPPSDIDVLVRQKVIDSLRASKMAPYCDFSIPSSSDSEGAAGGKAK
jgi:competence protein ComEA